MGLRYGIAYVCDGCGRREDTWPKHELGYTPGIYGNTPTGWRFVRCRDNAHRYDPRRSPTTLHLAHVLSCPDCAPDAVAWDSAFRAWNLARWAYARSLVVTLADALTFGALTRRWRQEHPHPGHCWPKAAGRVLVELRSPHNIDENTP